jgi:hypothetical protein
VQNQLRSAPSEPGHDLDLTRPSIKDTFTLPIGVSRDSRTGASRGTAMEADSCAVEHYDGNA